MNERDQAEKLIRQFKKTGLVNPVPVWEPTPTAGDHARALTNEIIEEAEAERPLLEDAAKAIWNHKPV